MNANTAAFLTMLGHSEGCDRPPAPEDPYRTCYGFKHVIANLTEHPAVSGEWHGERLSDKQCLAVGLNPPCFSTAAGRYQITKPTWIGWRDILRLHDFGPAAQDSVATAIIQKQGALELVNAGRVAEAINKCHPIWASLPGSKAGQPITPFAALMTSYVGAGGGFV